MFAVVSLWLCDYATAVCGARLAISHGFHVARALKTKCSLGSAEDHDVEAGAGRTVKGSNGSRNDRGPSWRSKSAVPFANRKLGRCNGLGPRSRTCTCPLFGELIISYPSLFLPRYAVTVKALTWG
jgi:hypothetical protein